MTLFDQVYLHRIFERVYQGSPFDFDKYDITKIGTGEGSASFGWGLYFSSSKEIGEWYSANNDKLISMGVDGKEYKFSPGAWIKDPESWEQDTYTPLSEACIAVLLFKLYTMYVHTGFMDVKPFIQHFKKILKTGKLVSKIGKDETYRPYNDAECQMIRDEIDFLKSIKNINSLTYKLSNPTTYEVEIGNRLKSRMYDWDDYITGEKNSKFTIFNNYEQLIKDYQKQFDKKPIFNDIPTKEVTWPDRMEKVKSDPHGWYNFKGIDLSAKKWYNEIVRQEDIDEGKKGTHKFTTYDVYGAEQPKAKHYYWLLSQLLGGEKDASLELFNHGIIGHYYKSGQIWLEAKGNINYVIYTDSVLNIKNKLRPKKHRHRYDSGDFHLIPEEWKGDTGKDNIDFGSIPLEGKVVNLPTAKLGYEKWDNPQEYIKSRILK